LSPGDVEQLKGHRAAWPGRPVQGSTAASAPETLDDLEAAHSGAVWTLLYLRRDKTTTQAVAELAQALEVAL